LRRAWAGLEAYPVDAKEVKEAEETRRQRKRRKQLR
jgi:hypothetical protein